jgi:hypothetical protein
MAELVMTELGLIVVISLMLTVGFTRMTLHWQAAIMQLFLS